MKAVIQRVVNASVAGQSVFLCSGGVLDEEVGADLSKVDGQTISSIGKGLLVLIGIDKSQSYLPKSFDSGISRESSIQYGLKEG